MATQTAKRDPNRVPSLIGVDSITFTDPTTVAVDQTTHEMLTKASTSLTPQTSNGLSVFNATSSDGATPLTNSAQAIKASAGQLYGWYIYNPNSSAQYVQLYNTDAASVVVGTTNPLFMLTLPATQAANVEFSNGITFTNATGWSTAATSSAGGNGAPSTALEVVFFYK